MKINLYFLFCILFISSKVILPINPMAAAMEAAAKKHSPSEAKKAKSTTTKKNNKTTKKEKKSTSRSKKQSTHTVTHKTVKTKKNAADLPKYIVTIKNNSPNKAAKISGISILYLPADSNKTVPISTSKTFTIPAKSISTVSLGLQLGAGESYAGASELIVGSNNDKISVDSNDWSTGSTNKSTSTGGGWISGVAGYPDAIYITFKNNKWIIDLEAMKSNGKNPKTPTKEPKPATSKTKSSKTTSHAVVATHKDHIKTKLNRKAKSKPKKK